MFMFNELLEVKDCSAEQNWTKRTVLSPSGGLRGGGGVCARAVCGGGVGLCGGSRLYCRTGSAAEGGSLSAGAAPLPAGLPAARRHELLPAPQTPQPLRQQGHFQKRVLILSNLSSCYCRDSMCIGFK